MLFEMACLFLRDIDHYQAVNRERRRQQLAIAGDDTVDGVCARNQLITHLLKTDADLGLYSNTCTSKVCCVTFCTFT